MADKTLADLLLEGEPATPDVFNVDNQTAQTGSARPSLADYLLTDTDTQLQVGTIPEQDVTRVPFKDADTWTGNFGLTIDQAQRDSFDMIRILGKRSGFEALENLGISGMSRNAAEIAQYKPKLESASLEKNIDNIINAYGEEGFLAAIGEFGEGLTQMTSSATASMALPLTGAAAAAAAAATLPVAAVSTGVAATVGAVIASIPQAGGSVYDEARKLGASEEDAENAAMIAAPLIGAAEAFVPARLFSGAVKKMGKDAVIDATAKHVGKVAARSAVERSMDLVKAGGKAFGKAGKAGLGVGLKESATEVIQEKLQISAAGLAADKGVSPYDTKEEIWRLLDAGALGLVGGQSMGSIGSIATQYEARAARQEADLVSEADAEVAKSNDTFNQQATKYTNISDNGVLRGLRSAVSRSTSLLDRAAKKYDSVARVKNAFDSYTDYVNADFGNYATQITDVFKPLYRNVKLPYASPVAKVDEEAVFDYLAGQEGNYTATQIEVAENLKPILGTQTQKQINLKRKDIKSFLSDPESFKSLLDTEGTGMSVTDKAKYNQSLNSLVQEYNTQIEKLTGEGIKNSKAKTMAADALTGKANKKKASVHYKALTSQPIQKAAGTGLFGDLLQANQNINFVDNYIPIRLMFKSKKNREKMKHILVSEHAFTPTEADNFVGNVRKSGGFANPDINLDMPQVYKKEGKSQSENQRTLNDDIRKSFIEAGLVDKNILGILYEYALDTSRRKNLQDIKQRVDDLKTSPDKPKLEQFEADRIVDVFNAIQGNYKTMDPDVRAAFSGAQFLGYVTTMPLAALSAIAEPAILLYTYGPRHVVPATFGAIYRTGRKAVREVFPKALPINKKEQAIRNTAQGWDEAVTDRLNEIEQIGLGRKLTNVFFKLTLLTQLTQLSRDIAADAGRRALRYDLQQVYNARDKGEKTRASVDSQRRLNKVGINNIFYPENKKILEEWVAGKYDKDPQNEPQLIRLAQSKMINDAIMAPDATKKPLWMSNPALAPVAQLKSFMFVFGNTVGYKMWTDLYQPLIKQGRFPAQQAFRGALALSTIMALSAFAQMLRDEIRYGDEDSPYDDMTEDEKLTYLLNRTAIGGPFQLIWDAFHGSSKYGGTPLDSFVGPVASKATTLGKELVSAAADGNVRGLSREALSLVPFLGTLSMERDIKADAVDALEELLEDNVVNRKHGGKVVQRAEGGQVAPTNEEMLKWDQVEGTDTTTEGSGSGAYDAATEGKLASYLSGEAKDAYNFLKNYDYSDLDIMDTLQKGGTAMLTGIADSIKSGVDASTKAVAGQEYNSNKMLGLVGGVGAGSAMFSAPKGALRSLGGKGKKASDVLAALKKSKLQGDFYHGTSSLEKGKALDNLKASKEGALGEGVYLTPSGDRASFYARLRADEVGGDAAVYPVRVDMSNPLEITGTHTDPVVEALVKLGVDEDKAYAISEKASETKGYITKEISSRAKKAGYDGIIQRVPDGRIGEVVVFDKDKVFSSVKFNEKLTPKEEGFKKGGAISKLRERSQTKKLSEGRQVVRRAEGGQLGNVSVPEEKPKPYEPSFNELFQTPDYVKLGLASALNEDKGTDKEFTEQDFAVETNRVVEHALELSKGNPNLLYEHYPNTAKGIPVRVFMGKELTTEEKKLRNEMYGGPDGYAKMLADIKMDPVLHAALTVGEAQKKTDGEYIIDERWNFNHLNNTSDNSYSLLRNIVGKSGLVAVGDESKGPRVRIKR